MTYFLKKHELHEDLNELMEMYIQKIENGLKIGIVNLKNEREQIIKKLDTYISIDPQCSFIVTQKYRCKFLMYNSIVSFFDLKREIKNDLVSELNEQTNQIDYAYKSYINFLNFYERSIINDMYNVFQERLRYHEAIFKYNQLVHALKTNYVNSDWAAVALMVYDFKPNIAKLELF